MIGDLVIEMVFQLRLMECYGYLVARSTVVPGADSPVGVGTGTMRGFSCLARGRDRLYAQPAGRWLQVPGPMVTVSPRWAMASPGGSCPPPGAAPGLWHGAGHDQRLAPCGH